jgi:hypothetical protein
MAKRCKLTFKRDQVKTLVAALERDREKYKSKMRKKKNEREWR